MPGFSERGVKSTGTSLESSGLHKGRHKDPVTRGLIVGV